MRVLFIGGKRFVGYHIAQSLLDNKHEVVFFNRGKTNAELFNECENIIGDRNKDLDKLKDRTFDWVIDTCAYFPKQVEDVLDILKGNFKKYLLISTIATVNPSQPEYDETVDVFKPDYNSTTITAETYGPLKVACEEVVQNKIGDKGIIIRPGYIVGDKDYTDRFSYYPVVMHFMDEVIMPKTGNLRFSFVDGKDLGRFVVHSLEENLSGIYHTVGPEKLYFNEFLEQCKKVVNPNCEIHYVDEEWLIKQGFEVSNAFPTCNLEERGNLIFSVNTEKARNAGFTTRSIDESIKDALQYFLEEKGTLDELKVGMNPSVMKKLIKEL